MSHVTHAAHGAPPPAADEEDKYGVKRRSFGLPTLEPGVAASLATLFGVVFGVVLFFRGKPHVSLAAVVEPPAPPAPPPWPPGAAAGVCGVGSALMLRTELGGPVASNTWGAKFIVASSEACCEACYAHAASGFALEDAECSAWVWCGGEMSGCTYGECWLKHTVLEPLNVVRTGTGARPSSARAGRASERARKRVPCDLLGPRAVPRADRPPPCGCACAVRACTCPPAVQACRGRPAPSTARRSWRPAHASQRPRRAPAQWRRRAPAPRRLAPAARAARACSSTSPSVRARARPQPHAPRRAARASRASSSLIRLAPNPRMTRPDASAWRSLSPPDGAPAGRIVFALFAAEAPLAAENFRQLATGEAGLVGMGREGAGRFYTFRGHAFYRIIADFIDQAGSQTESVYGGHFPDDAGGLALLHDKAGVLSVANMGPHTNGGHFSIMLGPAPHLNGQYVVFGEVVSGMSVARAINKLANPAKDTEPLGKAVIADCGELEPASPPPPRPDAPPRPPAPSTPRAPARQQPRTGGGGGGQVSELTDAREPEIGPSLLLDDGGVGGALPDNNA
jgi:cyclophilin family peptidyl-prolyl cis-trans isomerase